MSDLSFQPDEAEIERRVEALLFAAAGPLSAAEIAARLPDNVNVARALSGQPAEVQFSPRSALDRRVILIVAPYHDRAASRPRLIAQALPLLEPAAV